MFRQFNTLYVRDGPNALCALLDRDGFENVFKYMNLVCAAVFDLEAVEYTVFVNAIVMEIRNRIAV